MKWHLIFYPLAFVVTWLVSGNPFFWDTVQLASKHAHFFYDTDFQSIILPVEIDSGHPPLFGMYIAGAWKLFGKTLAVSHFAMLPFLWGIIFFLHKIGVRLAGEKNATWLLLLCFADPVLASQSILVSPDLVLVCFFLMAIWAIWSERPIIMALAIVGLGLISMRGMMVSVALFAFSFLLAQKWTPYNFLKKLFPFLPGGILAACYLFYHWKMTGWVGYHAGSTWAPSFEKVGLGGFIRNLGILAWRMLDFGRLFSLAVLAILLFVQWKRRSIGETHFSKKAVGWQLLALSVLIFLATVPTQLIYKGLLAHRYLLPFFLCLLFVLFYFLKKNEAWKRRAWIPKMAFPVAFFGLLTGNFWMYPKGVAMGWDSTLAHAPWYGLLNQTKAYLVSEEIDFQEVGTAFPNIGPRELYELDGNSEGFTEKKLDANCYIFYSNIMNDFSDEELATLESDWVKIFERKEGGVCAIIYKKQSQASCGN